MVDRGGLENRCTFTGTVGSNPTASAKYPSKAIQYYLINIYLLITYNFYGLTSSNNIS